MIRSKAFSCIALIAFASASSFAPAMAQPAGAAPAATQGADQSSYVLGVDDKVILTVFGEDSLSREYAIGPNGNMSVPLIGDVKAAGRSIGDVQAEITRRLSDGYLKDPSVSMQISTFRPFYIMGEVSKPGEYAYRQGLTVMAAVATAEGFTYRAKKKYAFIKHAGSTQEQRVEVTPDLLVQPGDTIRFSERYF